MNPIQPDKELMDEILDEHLDGMLRLAYRRDAEQKIEEIMEDSRRPFTPDEEAQIEAAYQQFLLKYAEYLRNQRKASRKARIRRAIRRTIRAVSCLILALAVVLPVALPYAVAKNERIRSVFLEVLVVYNEGAVSLAPVQITDKAFDLPAAWTGEYFPTYIPEGFTVNSVGQGEAYIDYTHENGSMFLLKEYSQYASVGVDTEGADVSYETINGAQATVITTPNAVYAADGTPITRYKIIWAVDDKYFLMITTAPKEESLKIAGSIRKITSGDPYMVPLEEMEPYQYAPGEEAESQ